MKIFKSKKMMIILGLIIFFIIISIFLPWDLKVSGDCTFFPEDKIIVRAKEAGIIKKISFKEGESVKKGDVIVQMDDKEFKARLETLKADREKINANLNMMIKGARKEELESAKSKVETYKVLLENAKKVLKRNEKLKDIISIQKIETSRDNVRIREKELERAESELRLLKAGTRKELIDAKKAELQKIEIEIKHLLTRIKKLKIKSTIEGTLITKEGKSLKERTGKFIKKGDEICRVIAIKKIIVEIPVSEKDISAVKIGNRVTIKARGFPGKTFEGKVTSIAPTAILKVPENTRIVTVKCSIDNEESLLKANMTGFARIHCGEKTLFYVIKRRIVRFFKAEFWF